MLNWLHSLPILTGAFVVCALFLVPTVLGSLLVQPYVARMFRDEKDINTVLGFLLNAFALYFGVLLALLSIAVFENHNKAQEAVDREAGQVVSLFRNIKTYPEPVRTELAATLKQYLDEEIGQGWAAQRQGRISRDGILLVGRMHHLLATYQPDRSEVSSVRHANTLRTFDEFVEARQGRISARGSRVPAIMWNVVIVGAILNVVVIWMFDVRRSTHVVIGGALSVFLGLAIYMIAILDEPFRGRDGLAPHGLNEVRQQIEVNR
ncbi:MAG: DUF4239 domain-containing protein [Pseudorhodoplanes sp.]